MDPFRFILSKIRLSLKVCEPRRSFYLNSVIWDVFVVLSEITLHISDSTGVPVSMESEIMRVVSLSTMEISEITDLKKKSDLHDQDTVKYVYHLFDKQKVN